MRDAYFGAVRATLERYGGVLEKFIGDAAVAVFGVPSARPDEAERAVRGALALRASSTVRGSSVVSVSSSTSGCSDRNCHRSRRPGDPYARRTLAKICHASADFAPRLSHRYACS